MSLHFAEWVLSANVSAALLRTYLMTTLVYFATPYAALQSHQYDLILCQIPLVEVFARPSQYPMPAQFQNNVVDNQAAPIKRLNKPGDQRIVVHGSGINPDTLHIRIHRRCRIPLQYDLHVRTPPHLVACFHNHPHFRTRIVERDSLPAGTGVLAVRHTVGKKQLHSLDIPQGFAASAENNRQIGLSVDDPCPTSR